MQQVVRARTGERKLMPGVGTYETADGYIFSMVGVPGFGAPWSVLAEWMSDESGEGNTELKDVVEFMSKVNLRELTAAMADAAKMEELSKKFEVAEKLLVAFYKQRGKQELYEEGQAKRLLIGPVNTPEDVVKSKQLQARSWFQEVDHNGVKLAHPGPPYRLPASPWSLRRRPPLLGEHNDEILGGELGLNAEDIAEAAGLPAGSPA
jgi:crotonobetainyl-CoA:carnitine CoA-transferase CaiB-like acyl-CoA transferase